MRVALLILVAVILWVGHAAIWTAVLSNLYGRALPKTFLKLWRLFTGLLILAFPIGVVLFAGGHSKPGTELPRFGDLLLLGYCICCGVMGGVVVPVVTVIRYRRRPPDALTEAKTNSRDLWSTVGPSCRGDGKYRFLTRLPGNGIFRLDVTELTLKLPTLPAALDGLNILVISDLHFHGTPSRRWFEAVFEVLANQPPPDVIALVGDYVDTDTHVEWLAALLGKLRWNSIGLAILGNHDRHHDPDRVRAELTRLGYLVIGNRWREVSIRGERVVVVGHEGPWIRPEPDLSQMPTGLFSLCLSHTPDQFPELARRGVDLSLSGHTHGGAIRMPIVGSIFVPCTTGRRYDCGVFQRGESVLVVGRGLSGKEPIRIRCNPQVIRLVLTRSG